MIQMEILESKKEKLFDDIDDILTKGQESYKRILSTSSQLDFQMFDHKEFDKENENQCHVYFFFKV